MTLFDPNLGRGGKINQPGQLAPNPSDKGKPLEQLILVPGPTSTCCLIVSWNGLPTIEGIRPNFAYALILTRPGLGLLCVNFRKFIAELWPLIDVGISFPLNIFNDSMEFDKT